MNSSRLTKAHWTRSSPRRAENIDKADPVIEETKEIPDFYVHTNVARPRVFIPTMPGNNCEVDSARAFERAGAVSDIFIFRNRDSAELKASVDEMAERISHAQIVMFPGGFMPATNRTAAASSLLPYSATKSSRKPWRSSSTPRWTGSWHLQRLPGSDQAGPPVPYGEFKPLTDDSPTLTFNTIGRHLSAFRNDQGRFHQVPVVFSLQAGRPSTASLSATAKAASSHPMNR